MIQDSNWRPLPGFLTIKESTIEGLGLFTTKTLPAGTDLGITHIYDTRFQDGYIRLPLGAFINHHEIRPFQISSYLEIETDRVRKLDLYRSIPHVAVDTVR